MQAANTWDKSEAMTWTSALDSAIDFSDGKICHVNMPQDTFLSKEAGRQTILLSAIIAFGSFPRGVMMPVK